MFRTLSIERIEQYPAGTCLIRKAENDFSIKGKDIAADLPFKIERMERAPSVRRGLAPAEFVCFKDALRFIWRVYASEKKGNYVTADLPFKIERMERAPSVRRRMTFR